MTEVIQCCSRAGFNDFWAVLLEAQSFGVPIRRNRYLMIASVSGVENWFLQNQVMFSVVKLVILMSMHYVAVSICTSA
jgi:hypothetical protein